MEFIRRASPHFRNTLAVLLVLLVLALSNRATAQTAAQAQQSATGTGQAIISPNAINITSNGAQQLPWTGVSQDFHTNQAASAPANIGSVAPGSNTGCPAVDGWSGSVVVLNGGKTTASELPGCMFNILGQNLGMLKVIQVKDPVTGVVSERFDRLSVARLEAWCLYPPYKKAIENGLEYKCKDTRDAEEAQRRNVIATVPGAGVVSNDPYIAQSGREYPSRR